jgi:hypothetical protein
MIRDKYLNRAGGILSACRQTPGKYGVYAGSARSGQMCPQSQMSRNAMANAFQRAKSPDKYLSERTVFARRKSIASRQRGRLR